MGEEQLYRFFQTDSEDTVLHLKKSYLKSSSMFALGSL